MKCQSLAVVLILSLFSTVSGAADCSREDIDHYLDRGFSPQQVLELCRPEMPDETDQSAQARDASYWRDVIHAREVRLSADTLSFVRDQCIAYDRPNFAQQRKKACGKVYYSIGLDGLEVLETSKKLLYWGQNSIAVSSPSIQRRYELNQSDLPERDQRILKRELPRGDSVDIPIHDGVALDVVASRLQRLGR